MKIKFKLSTIIIIFILAISGIGFYSKMTLEAIVNQNSLLKDKMEMQKNIIHIQYRLAGLSNDERGLLNTGETEFVDGMKEKQKDVNDSFQSLYKLNPTPEEKSQIKKMEESFASYRSLNQQVITLEETNPAKAKDLHFGKERTLRKEVLDPSVTEFVDGLEKTVGTLKDSMNEEAKTSKVAILSVTLGASALGVILGLFLLMTILKPLRLIMNQMKNIANGEADLTRKIQFSNKDEFGELANSFNQFIHSLKEIIKQIGYSSEQLAASSEEFSASADESRQTSQLISSSMQQISYRAGEQSVMTETSLHSVKESFSAISTISTHSSEVANVASLMKEKAESGETTVGHVVKQMSSINQSVELADKRVGHLVKHAHEIDEITNLINEISEQTNLLALNAAIEAARAGESGKGFAIVAEEVRKLAEKSNKSANNIRELVGNIQTDTKETVRIIQTVKTDVNSGIELTKNTVIEFTDIAKMINNVSTEIHEIAASSEQLSASFEYVHEVINNISNGANETSNSVSEIATASEQQYASMEEIQHASSMLSKLAEELQYLVYRFKV